MNMEKISFGISCSGSNNEEMINEILLLKGGGGIRRKQMRLKSVSSEANANIKKAILCRYFNHNSKTEMIPLQRNRKNKKVLNHFISHILY